MSQSRSFSTHASEGLSIQVLQPTVEEKMRYRSIGEMVTVANEALYIGKVGGRLAAAAWANSTTNTWQLPASHPRNSDKKKCVDLARIAYEMREPPRAVFLKELRRNHTLQYLIHAKRAYIHPTGVVGLGTSCGYVQMHEGCETIFKFIGRKWFDQCEAHMRAELVSWNSLFVTNLLRTKDLDVVQKFAKGCIDKDPVTKNHTLPQRHERVFVITSLWDSNYHHFLTDSITRLVRHLAFIKNNPDVKIHIRAMETGAKKPHIIKSGLEMRRRIWEVLNISLDRIISGPVLANEVFLPRAPRCNAPIHHALELRLLADALSPPPPRVREKIKIKSKKRKVILQQRICVDPKKCKTDWRHYDDETVERFASLLSRAFPTHAVVIDDPRKNMPLSDNIKLYQEADILVGLHGAGFTNMMFMRNGSLAVEISGKWDGRMLPLCGFHSPLAAVFGVHMFHYFYDMKSEQQDLGFIVSETSRIWRHLSRSEGVRVEVK